MAVDPQFIKPVLQVGTAGAGQLVFQGKAAGGDDFTIKTKGDTDLALGIGCRCSYTVNQSITSGAAAAALSFNTEIWDTDGIHSNSPNPERFVCQTTGYYHVYGNIAWATTSGVGYRQVQIWQNIEGIIAVQTVYQSTANFSTHLNISCVTYIPAGQYLELRVYQSSGAALNVEALANYSPIFGMQRIG